MRCEVCLEPIADGSDAPCPALARRQWELALASLAELVRAAEPHPAVREEVRRQVLALPVPESTRAVVHLLGRVSAFVGTCRGLRPRERRELRALSRRLLRDCFVLVHR